MGNVKWCKRTTPFGRILTHTAPGSATMVVFLIVKGRVQEINPSVSPSSHLGVSHSLKRLPVNFTSMRLVEKLLESPK